MYRRSLFALVMALSLAGCYGGSGYYESDVYTQPTVVRSYYDNPGYYPERRIYVAPQPRYYEPPPQRYYAPPPPRVYVPGRPPGHGWDNRWRDHDRRHDDDRRDRDHWDDHRDRNRWEGRR